MRRPRDRESPMHVHCMPFDLRLTYTLCRATTAAQRTQTKSSLLQNSRSNAQSRLTARNCQSPPATSHISHPTVSNVQQPDLFFGNPYRWNPPTAAAVPPEPSPNALKLVKLREDTTRKLKQARAALEKLKSERDQAVAAQKTAEFKLKRGVSQVKQEEAKAREAEGDAFRGRIFKLKSELKVETDKKLKAERELRTRLRAAKKFYEREKEAKLRAEAKLKEIGEGTQAERDAEKEAEKKIGALRAQVHALEDAKHVVDEKLDEVSSHFFNFLFNFSPCLSHT